MSQSRVIRVYQVDVFAENLFEGNPAGVVPDASTLTDEEMQRIARELANSETAFLFPPRNANHDVWVRFFTPVTEVPLCGHATLAAQAVFALERDAIEGSANEEPIRQGSAGGTWSVIVSGGGSYAEMIQEPVTCDGELETRAQTLLLEALGLERAALDPRCPVEIHSTGHAKVMVGIRHGSTLDRLRPDLDALTALGRQLGIDGFFLFTLDTGRDDLTTECRMFAPGIGVPEDPVNGSGQGPLGAYLVRHQLMPQDDGRASFVSSQGRVMGRPGLAQVTVEVENGVPSRVRVGGRIRIVFRTEIDLDGEVALAVGLLSDHQLQPPGHR